MKRIAFVIAALAAAWSSASAKEFCLLSVEEDGGALMVIEPVADNRLIIPMAALPHEIAVTADGSRAFVSLFGVRDYDLRQGTPGEEVAVVDLNIGKRLARWKLPAVNGVQLKAPHGVKLRPPKENELFVNAEMGVEAMAVLDAKTGAVVRTFPLPAGVHNFVFDRNGKALFAFAGANGVYKLDPENGVVLAHADVGSPVRGLAFTWKGDALIASAKGEVVLLSPKDLAVKKRFPIAGEEQIFYSVAYRDMILAPTGFGGSLAVLDAKSGAVEKNIATGKTPIIVQVAPDGRAYVSNVQDKHISVVDLKAGTTTQFNELNGPNGLGFGRCPAVMAQLSTPKR